MDDLDLVKAVSEFLLKDYGVQMAETFLQKK